VLSCLLLSYLLPSVSAQGCLKPSEDFELSVNNIRAYFQTTGIHFHRGNAEFEVPKGSGKHTFFSTNLWLGGKDAEDKLHLTATTYGSSGSYFWTGTVSNGGNASASAYDKSWALSKEEVEYHKTHYIDEGYMMSEKIANWPAHGRTEDGESPNLAPYKSVSGNSTYTPYQGDYPLIRGNQAFFWINNDKCATYTEEKGALGVEIMSMAYAYNQPEYELQHTIFLSYEIRNTSVNNYKDFYIGFFADFDIGNGWDDYIGCDSLLNLSYGYNGNKTR
jgi:hypothetical protein